ncbi:hypothetical protein Pla108_09710 [Botrimarina colliarenosi]|uniref:Bacterial type II secretion system protein G n=1 Tax=Botrimarina colliarenosi TaxID=2528001 RepID=A0A5C6AKL7_9BACT|nr:hypothetical protein [Botrimarina colliarenosi]TWU00028.1 hypothetical protein Pla108_09710 [Botrimarina colliarenosi]
MFDSPIDRHRRTKKSTLPWWLLALATLTAVGLVLYVTFGPNPPIVISKATTHRTTPLAADGLPDYAAALLAKMRKDVTPDNNGAIPLLEAMWPEGDDAYSPTEAKLLIEELGMPDVPNPTRRIETYGGDAMNLAAARLYRSRVAKPANIAGPPASEEIDFGGGFPTLYGTNDAAFWSATDDQAAGDIRVEELVWLALDRPWTAEDLPFAAEWIEANRAGLDRLHDAAEKSHFYLPAPEHLAGGKMAELGNRQISLIRSAARHLELLCNYALGCKRYDDAAHESVSLLKMAHHVGRGRLMIDQLLASAFEGMGMAQIQALAADPATPGATLRWLLKVLDGSPPACDIVRTIEGERWYGLDSLIRGEATFLESWLQPTDPLLGLASRTSIDWNPVLVALNEYHDRKDAAYKLPTPRQQADALQQLADDYALVSQIDPFAEPMRLLTPAGRAGVISQAVLASFSVTFEWELTVPGRDKTKYEATRLALALAIYRTDHNAYPASLDELVPAVLPKLPVDTFTDAPFLYRLTDDGYLLYSCGANGVDDGGSHDQSYYGPSQTFEGIKIREVDGAPDKLTADEQAMVDMAAQIPAGADDWSLRVPIPVEPWPWEKQPAKTPAAEAAE